LSAPQIRPRGGGLVVTVSGTIKGFKFEAGDILACTSKQRTPVSIGVITAPATWPCLATPDDTEQATLDVVGVIRGRRWLTLDDLAGGQL